MSSFGNNDNDEEDTTTRYSGSFVQPDLFTEEELTVIAAAGTGEEIKASIKASARTATDKAIGAIRDQHAIEMQALIDRSQPFATLPEPALLQTFPFLPPLPRASHHLPFLLCRSPFPRTLHPRALLSPYVLS